MTTLRPRLGRVYSLVRKFALGSTLLATALASIAQTPGTGTITGRVYNPATKEYVRDAEVSVQGVDRVTATENDGSYTLTNVPAGTATVEVRFTGYTTASAQVNVAAGQTATRDFDIKAVGSTDAKGDDVIKLTEFVVNSEREGNAKAIMDQKRAMTVSNIVAAETFGNISEGNIGEFVKYLPGIQMDMVEADARSPRIRGLPAQYTTVTFDGMQLASADGFIQNNGTDNGGGAGSGGRSFGFEQVSMSSVDAVEVNFTTTAAADANSPAGNINLRSKHAFERSGQLLTFDISAMMNSEQFHLRKTYGPDDKNRYKIFPNGMIEYSNVFLNRKLGVILSFNQSESYNEQHQFAPAYDTTTTPTDTRPYVLTRIQYKDGPKYNERTTGSFTIDYKVSPRMAVSLKGIINNYYAFIGNRSFGVSTTRANIPLTSDGLTSWGGNAIPVTALTHTMNYLLKRTHGYTYLPSIEYKTRNLRIDAAAVASKSENNYGGGQSKEWAGNSVGGTSIPLTGMTVRANRGADLYDWRVEQTGGADWSNIAAYVAGPTASPTFGYDGRYNKNLVYQGKVDARYTTPFRIPTWIQVGGKVTQVTYVYANPTAWQTWNYIGPGGGPGGSWALFPGQFKFSPGHGAGFTSLSGGTPQVQDHTAIGYLFKTNPEYFQHAGTPGNFLTAFVVQPRYVREQIDAAYAMANTKPTKQLELQGGLRFERTRDLVKDFDPLPSAQVVAAGFPVNATGQATTIPGMMFQFLSQPRATRTKEYASIYPSASAKYSIKRNLQALAGYSYTVTRPAYNDIAGSTTENEQNQEITLPNINLKPQYAHNLSTQLTYFFEPVGILSVGAFQNEFQGYIQTSRVADGAAAFGYDDPFYATYDVITKFNLDGTVRYRGATVEYRQALSFLPKPFDGFDVFANYTRTYANIKGVSPDVINQPTNNLYNFGWLPGIAPHVVNYGISYKWRRLNLGFKARWTDKMGTTSTRNTWMKANTKVDANISYQVTDRLQVYFNARNLFNTRDHTFIGDDENRIGGGRQIEYYGAYLYFGLKGKF